jgi:hypothetical protein
VEVSVHRAGSILFLSLAVACTATPSAEPGPKVAGASAERLAKYVPVRLTADLSGLTDAEREMLPILIEAATHMDRAFWRQAYGDPQPLLDSITDDATRRFVELNYGPWDRLAGNEPFVAGVGEKPLGATFYPPDATKEELEEAAASNADIFSLYTMVRRNEDGSLGAVPYSEYFAAEIEPTAELLARAAELAADPGLRNYLELRVEALRTDVYQPSDLAWMDMKDNAIDVVIGPIETYEDRLFGAKAAFEAYVLLKDRAWSERLQKYAAFLPDLQKGLPVDEKYKSETPGRDSDLNAYDVLYYAGDCNAGSKTIAINLPNDEEVQLEKGTRRLQLKNAMRAKFDGILVPIAGVLIAEEQRANITFDAFFANTMFHEVAHGLGIKNTITGAGKVRAALRDLASTLEEGKADVLGLYMVTSLADRDALDGDATLDDYYTTFVAGIFRSIRFGAASAHGGANLVRFNFFRERGAFVRDEASGTYRVDASEMRGAVAALSKEILEIQGNGDYAAAQEFMAKYGVMGEQLRADLARLDAADIPVDVYFEQGVEVLGLGK